VVVDCVVAPQPGIQLARLRDSAVMYDGMYGHFTFYRFCNGMGY
jgi:hypothetical protein